jgi:hypothetical protein
MKIWKKPQKLKSNVNYKIHYKFEVFGGNLKAYEIINDLLVGV